MSDGGSRSYRPFWWESTTLMTDGRPLHVRWKACVFQDGAVMFDVEPAFSNLVQRKTSTKTCWELRQAKGNLLNWFQFFGWRMDDEIPPSTRQVSSGLQAADKSCEALTMSFRGLLAMLSIDAAFKKDKDRRDRAFSVLENVLGRLLPLGFDVANIVAACSSPEVCCLCMHDVEDGRCAHWRKTLTLMPAADARPLQKTVSTMVAHMSFVFECAAVASIASHLVDTVAVQVGSGLPTRGFKTDAYKACNEAGTASGSTKRKHYDADYKRSLTGPLCKRDNVDYKQMRNWMCDDLGSMQRALWRTFPPGRRYVVNVAEDGARVGNPAEELIVYYAHAPALEVACWLPPQAR
jgi:hypothetical protein